MFACPSNFAVLDDQAGLNAAAEEPARAQWQGVRSTSAKAAGALGGGGGGGQRNAAAKQPGGGLREAAAAAPSGLVVGGTSGGSGSTGLGRMVGGGRAPS